MKNKLKSLSHLPFNEALALSENGVRMRVSSGTMKKNVFTTRLATIRNIRIRSC